MQNVPRIINSIHKEKPRYTNIGLNPLFKVISNQIQKRIQTKHNLIPMIESIHQGSPQERIAKPLLLDANNLFQSNNTSNEVLSEIKLNNQKETSLNTFKKKEANEILNLLRQILHKTKNINTKMKKYKIAKKELFSENNNYISIVYEEKKNLIIKLSKLLTTTEISRTMKIPKRKIEIWIRQREKGENTKM